MGTANPASQTAAQAIQSPTAPTMLSDQGSIVEPRPMGDAPAASENMFLSPRVLDAGAFTRYSEMLKSIITQATNQGRTLEDFSTDAQAMIKRCDVTSEAINKRMQAGLRMIKMIDDRADRTDQLLSKVQASLPDSQEMMSKIDALIEERIAESQRRVELVVADAEARVIAAEQRTHEAIKANEEQAQKLAHLTSLMDGKLEEMDAKIESARQQTTETLAEIISRTDSISSELNNSIDQVLSRAHEAGANLAYKIDDASKLTDARIVELNNSIQPVLEASQQAMRTLGMDPENPVFEDSPLARIEQLVERGETQLATLDRVFRQLEDLQSQAEGVKAVFGMWLVDAAGELDVLEARKDTLVGPMCEAADKIAKLGPDLEDKLELASTQLTHLQIEQQTLRQTIQASSTIANEVTDGMTNQSGQLQALLDGSLHKLSTRVEQAGVWLGALIQRAESLAGAMPGAGQFGDQTSVEPVQAAPQIPAVSAPAPAPAPIIERAIESAQAPVEPTIKQESEDMNKPTLTCDPITCQPIEVEVPRSTQKQVEPKKTDSIPTPLPPQLPIDSLSFEGSPVIIEHTPDEQRKNA